MEGSIAEDHHEKREGDGEEILRFVRDPSKFFFISFQGQAVSDNLSNVIYNLSGTQVLR